MDKKHILFDGDGVTIIPEKMFSEQFEEEQGLPKGSMKPFFRKEFGACAMGKADLKEVLIPYFKEWKWKGGMEEFLRYWFESEHALNEKLFSYISKLREKGVQCFLATNNEKYRTQYILQEWEFDKLFDGVFSSCDIGYKKPQKEYYEYILQTVGSQPQDILYFDDEQENVDIARELGIEAHVYGDVEQVKELIE